jgi:Cu(I)/Ag(I) efflux system membrane protein CusA/SilA
MINRIIEWSLRNGFLVICAALLLAGFGIRALYQTPVDAIPDLSENQVIVYADWMGRSPQEVEDQVTYPLSVNLQGLAGVKAVRAASMFGFSLITVVFDDQTDNYFARSRILEKLSSLGDVLPAGVQPKLGSDATGLGWVYEYYLDVDPNSSPNGGYDLGQLRSIQDWFVRYQLNAVSGVAEVASIGGEVKQYQIEVSSLKMRDHGVMLSDVMDAVKQSNLNVGGKVIEENGMEFVVRGIGLVNSIADLENIVVSQNNGLPVFLKDIATIQLGGDFRRGALDVNGHEAVGGIVIMRNGENAMAVIKAVKEKIAQISSGLPQGVSIRAFYDRSNLITRTLDTLKHALTEEIILVTLVIVIFLFHFRSIFIVVLPLPLSILVSFILMNHFGISSNIMSLSGIAIAIGVLVDAGIVMVENVIRHCEHAEKKKGGQLNRTEIFEVTLEAARQVGRPIFFAVLIIILAFVPVFALSGQEGKLFHPLAFTKTFAMIGAAILAITLVPVLCATLIRGKFKGENENLMMRGLLAIYDPVLSWALRFRKTVLTLAGISLIAALILAFGLPRPIVLQISKINPGLAEKLPRGMGSEFMPPLNEGSLLFMPVLLPDVSLSEVQRIMAWQDTVIHQAPEVESVAGKLGRAETATDPAPAQMIETTIMLKPESQWRAGMTKEKLVAELTEKLGRVPGYVPGFLQPIQNRILMISTGIRAQVGIKILGDNLDAIQKKAFEIEKVVRTIPGAVGVAASRMQGKPYLNIEINRAHLAHHGLRAQDVLDVVEGGIGGENISTVIDGRERIPVQVRFERDERDDIDRLSDILVPMGMGKYIPLGQVATISRNIGPDEIDSENGQLRVFVQANVEGRDLGGFVKEAQARIAKEIQLPPGVTIEWSGQYENQIHAQHTLLMIVPTVLLVIFLLLYIVYHSLKEAVHVLLAVPFALTGGVFLQWFLGYNFSVAVWVGYIALFGTAIQTGVVMVVYLQEAVAKKRSEMDGEISQADLLQAVKDGARLRLRPKVMTVATVIGGLLPILWSSRAGAEVMKPLAAPIIGGMASSLVCILIVTPVIFAWMRERELKNSTNEKSNAG